MNIEPASTPKELKSSAFSPFRLSNEKTPFPSVSLSCPQYTSHPLLPYPSFVSPSSYIQRYCSHDMGVLPAYLDAKGLSYLPAGPLPGMPINFHHTEEEKPSQSYIGLIGKAILSAPHKKLVLSDIYNYILTHYPYFRNKGPGWRNSIRHNLSLNECFIKVGRSPNGKGHFWAINPANYEDFSRGEYRRKRANKKRTSSTHFGDAVKPTTEKEREIAPKLEQRNHDVLRIQSAMAEQTSSKQNKGFHIETLLATSTCSVSNRPQTNLYPTNTFY